MALSTADLQTTLHGVRALLLDLDGVIILKGEPVRGSVAAISIAIGPEKDSPRTTNGRFGARSTT